MENKIQPIITIVTPSYNQGQFIEETIQSVLNQTYKNIQYIIVDGGSTDNTMEVVNKYREQIDIIIHEKDKGQTDAINKGFKLAKGKLVGWINSDDILYIDCVEKIVELYNTNMSASIYYHSWLQQIDANGSVLKTYQHVIPSIKHLIKSNYNVVQQGSFYSLAAIQKVNYLNDTIYYCMDLDLWLKIGKLGSIICTLDKPRAAFRMYAGTKTDTGQEKFLFNINQVLHINGAKFYHKTIYHKIYFYMLKLYIKKLILFIYNKK